MAFERYRFRNFILDASARELSRDGELVSLPSRAFDCLVYLVRNRDRAVGRDELIAGVWGRVDVADTLLAQTILRLRRTLGDDAAHGAVRTVARFGYRWVEDTEVLSEPAPVAVPVPETAPADADGALAGETIAAAVQPTGEPAAPVRNAEPRRWRVPAIAAGVAALAMIAIALWPRADRPGGDTPAIATAPPGRTAPDPGATPRPQPLRNAYASVMVLPAQVPDVPDGSWLRLGLMDMVGHRLRQGGLPILPSENVLGLVAAGAPLDPAGDTLIVQPVVEQAGEEWRVRLELPHVLGAPHVQASSLEPLRASHDVADLLLIRLGRAPTHGGDAQPLALSDLLLRVRAASLGDRFDVALKLIDDAAPELRGHPELELARARIEQGQGLYESAERRLLALRETVSGEDDPLLLGHVTAATGAVHFRRGNLDDAEAAFAQAVELLQGRGDPLAFGQALMGRAAVASRREQLDAAEADLGRARNEMEAAGDLLGVAQIDMNLGLTQIKRYRPASALPLLREAERRFIALGAREELVYSRYVITSPQLQLLDIDSAAETVERFWPPAAHTGNERLVWRLALTRAFLLGAQGRLDEAEAQVAEILAGTRAADDAPVRAGAEGYAALLTAMRGRHAEAVEALHAQLTPAMREQRPDMFVTVWMAYLRSLRHAGQHARAATETERFGAWIDANPNPWRQVQHALARAEQAVAQDGAEASLPLFEQAYELARQLAIPEDLVHVAEPYTAALIEAGRIDRASAVAGSVAAWAAQDVRAAWAQAQLFRAQGRDDAWQRAMERVEQLRGQRVLPP